MKCSCMEMSFLCMEMKSSCMDILFSCIKIFMHETLYTSGELGVEMY